MTLSRHSLPLGLIGSGDDGRPFAGHHDGGARVVEKVRVDGAKEGSWNTGRLFDARTVKSGVVIGGTKVYIMARLATSETGVSGRGDRVRSLWTHHSPHLVSALLLLLLGLLLCVNPMGSRLCHHLVDAVVFLFVTCVGCVGGGL